MHFLAIQVQQHSFLNCSCTADHDGISWIQIYSFKVDYIVLHKVKKISSTVAH